MWNASSFAMDEAQEGGDDEDWGDDVDSDIEDGAFKAHVNETQKRYEQRRNIYAERPRTSVMDTIERLASRFDHEGDAMSVVSGADADTVVNSRFGDVAGAPRLPILSDPKLWLVPCLGGRERWAVKQLMEKYFKYRQHPTKTLFIKTAFTTDQNIGYIYVEAYREVHVREAVQSVSGLNGYKIRLVPTNEMHTALHIKMTAPTVRVGQWCRFARGAAYRNDLAQVVREMDQGSRVVVRVVPRLDLSRVGQSRSLQRSKDFRPQPKLFNKQEIQSMGGEVETINSDQDLRTTVYKFQGKKFRHGYLLKTVNVEHLNFDITATQDEVQRFQTKLPEDNTPDEFAHVPPPIIRRQVEFVRGETVRVIKGPLENLIGEVLSTRPDPTSGTVDVFIKPDHKLLDDTPLSFKGDELQKYFRDGCHVKVTKGKYKDETGLIIRVDDENNEIILFSDLTAREIRVSIDEVTETSEVSTGRDVYGQFHLYELVSLSRDVVGVIVEIQANEFRILDNKGTIQKCRIQDITRHTRDKHAVALDIDNLQIRLGDVVIPQLGKFHGQRATVKHIYRGVLFCHTKSCTENSGIFIVRSRFCNLTGGRNRAKTTNNLTTASRGGRGRGGKNRMHRNDPWMGRTVRVIRGPEKSQRGIVKKVTDRSLTVELHGKMKRKSFRREDVKLINADGSEVTDGQSKKTNRTRHVGRKRTSQDAFGRDDLIGAKTPRIDHSGSRTPALIGTQTPHIYTPRYGGGGITPRHGESTPGGMTPYGGGVTPAYGSYTPHIGSETPAMGSFTPHINSHVGSTTPSSFAPRYDTNASTSMAEPSPRSPYDYNPSAGGGTPRSSMGGSMFNSTPRSSGGFTSPQSYHDPMDQDVDYSDADGSHLDASLSGSGSDSDTGGILAAMDEDPCYFVVRDAILLYGRDIVQVVEDTPHEGTCEIAYPQEIQPNGTVLNSQTISRTELRHLTPKEGDRVKVVLGNMRNEVGEFIGVDQEDAIVKIESSQEVQIIPKATVVKIPSGRQ